MASSTYDLTIRAGDDHTFVVTWLPDGTATDLTGATADMRIEWARYSGGYVSLSSADDEIEIDVSANTITVHMSDTFTRTIGGVDSIYQLRVNIDGAKTTIASGRVTTLRSLLDE